MIGRTFVYICTSITFAYLMGTTYKMFFFSLWKSKLTDKVSDAVCDFIERNSHLAVFV